MFYLFMYYYNNNYYLLWIENKNKKIVVYCPNRGDNSVLIIILVGVGVKFADKINRMKYSKLFGFQKNI
jgi:hypothetical protein